MLDFRAFQQRRSDGDRIYRLLLPVLQRLADLSPDDLNALYVIAAARVQLHERNPRQPHSDN